MFLEEECEEPTEREIASDEIGTILSENFPGTYGDYLFCQWKITAPPGEVITLLFNELEVGLTSLYMPTGTE